MDATHTASAYFTFSKAGPGETARPRITGDVHTKDGRHFFILANAGNEVGTGEAVPRYTYIIQTFYAAGRCWQRSISKTNPRRTVTRACRKKNQSPKKTGTYMKKSPNEKKNSSFLL